MPLKYLLAVLASHPIQYVAPLYRAIAAREEIDLTVYYCWNSVGSMDPDFQHKIEWDIPLFGGYRHEFLTNLSPRPGPSFLGQVNPGILRELRRRRYDAILVQNYTIASSWLALLGAWRSGTPMILRGVADLLFTRPGYKRALKKMALPWLFGLFDAFLWSCSSNADYFRHYGVRKEKLFFFPCAVDNDFWRREVQKFRGKKAALKAEAGIPPEAPVILFVAKLVPRKRPMLLMEAFERLPRGASPWLLFVGDGPQRGDLERRARERGLDRVVFAGFQNQTRLSRFYAMADVFVLPSDRDPEPKALNEAMNFGLPALVSDRLGTAGDLVRPGENGYICPLDDVESWAERLSELVASPSFRREMGRRSAEIVAEWSFENDVNGLIGALESIRGARFQGSADA